MPKFQTQAKLLSFSRSKLIPVTKATEIQPKTKEGNRTKGRERKRRATAIVVVVAPMSTTNRNGSRAQGFGHG